MIGEMIGESFGNYRIVSLLGSGAMGTVYLGQHERIARRAAIKLLEPNLAANDDLLRRFFNEARATSLIRHPAIVEVIDCGIHADGRQPYIVMEYLLGETLAEHLEKTGAVPWPEACATVRQIAEGLAAAHRHGIVHRDVKPANVMLVAKVDVGAAADATPRPPPAPVVKVLDFGVAKLLHDAQSMARTHPGKLLGTPEYMAPEQCGAPTGVDGRTDVYALGCVMFEMVCGRPPFLGETCNDLTLAHQWRQAPAASSFADLPVWLDQLIARMLSKRPEDRPPDMEDVARSLRDAPEGPVDRAAVSSRGRSSLVEPRPARAERRPAHALPSRRPLAIAAGIVAVAAVVGVAAHLGNRARTKEAAAPAAARHHATPAPVSQSMAPAPDAPRSTMPPAAPRGMTPTETPPSTTPAPAPRAAAPANPRRPPAPARARARRLPEVDTDGIVDL